MNRAEVLQEVRLMKFDDLYSRRTADKLTQEQAAEILGISVRTMRRWEERYEAEGQNVYMIGALASWRTTVFQRIQPWRCLSCSIRCTGTTRLNLRTAFWSTSKKATS